MKYLKIGVGIIGLLFFVFFYLTFIILELNDERFEPVSLYNDMVSTWKSTYLG